MPQLLREFCELCPNGVCNPNFLTEQEKSEMQDGNSTYLVGIFQRADTVNGNGRIYPRHVLEREVENYQKLIREKRSVGCCDHEDKTEVSLKETSHIVTQLWWEGNNLMGKLRVLNTPSGKIVQTLIKDGVQLGISSRALGSLSEGKNGEQLVGEDLALVAFDIVAEPSTPGALLRLSESKQYSQLPEIFNKADKINRLLSQICGRL